MAAEIFYETLNETERAARDSLTRFAEEVLRPAGKALDLLTPEEVIAKDSILYDVHRQYRELGLGAVGADGALTPAEAARLRALSSEIMGWGDSGLAISLGASGMPSAMAAMSFKPDLMKTFSPDKIGCWAITEPDHGSDLVDFTSRDESGFRSGNCVAKRDGDQIVITGQKSAWVSNGTIAQTAALFTAYEEAGKVKGGGVFLVPLDAPGVTRGKPTHKVGQRPLNQGEIFFDDVVIPAEYMVAGPEMYSIVLETVLTGANAGMGSVFMGLARAALEHAVAYAKERVQGGKPIIQHQAVQTRLFELFRKVEAARSLNLKVVQYNATNPPKLELSIATKVTSTRTALEVATEAMFIYGGAGMTVENPIEKLMRDAAVSLIEDGENTLLGLVAAQRI